MTFLEAIFLFLANLSEGNCLFFFLEELKNNFLVFKKKFAKIKEE
jgi:hypothetical protein